MNYLFKALLMIKHIRNQQENKKSPSAKAKGLELSGSPYWSASELLRGIS